MSPNFKTFTDVFLKQTKKNLSILLIKACYVDFKKGG